ncbi:YifB family Mg chelatase-like AAA ATPase [Pseudolysinimonas sp.]|uniref:YifB family Mg chelatase-like AAA ATPase n=1 Tax=Pseudolysinimonas sp. TaxID=2680009 RepID=UPI003F7E2953
MPLARTHAVALLGIDGVIVQIEADISSNLPGFVLIGLPDAALGEARDRVRAAAHNSELAITARKLTVNLSPAALPKHGSAFDLAIALAALAADGKVPAASVDRVVHLGELALDGRVRPVSGVLPAVLAAARAGYETVVVPAGNADEARLVEGVRIVGMASLRDAAIWHGAELDQVECDPIPGPAPTEEPEDTGDLADIVGNEDAIDAAQVAAAGGHHLFLLGPPGAGKTMLAARLPGLLPDLDDDAALEVASIRSLGGSPVGARLTRRPPFEAPHHTSSAASMIGGGSGWIRPGSVVRAAHGVLFLDEAPEFPAAALDALRQPLESGVVAISRVYATARYPARFQLVLAANPCPCGLAGVDDSACTCAPFTRRRYLGRLSGPLLDRVDIQLTVRRITAAQLRATPEHRRTSGDTRARIVAARGRAADRLRATPWRLNAQVSGPWLRSPAGAPVRGATAALDRALERGALTMRGYDRVLKVAWTVCDLEDAERPTAEHIGRALFLRKAMAE